MEHRNYKVVYRRYASLFFLVGIDGEEVSSEHLNFATANTQPPPCSRLSSQLLHALQNELAILEFIHCLVETLDRYFSNVCELDLMFNLEMVRQYPIPNTPYTHISMFPKHIFFIMLRRMLPQAHYILDEMLMNGCIVETNKQNVLVPIQLLEKAV